MKILHVLWGFQYGGAEAMLSNIVNKQCKENAVEILLINDVIEQNLISQIDESVVITRINRPSGSKNPFYILKLNWLILSSKADIIHFHQDNIIRYIPSYKLKKNLCLTVHCVKTDAKDIRKYNYAFAITEAVKEQVTEKVGRSSVVIYNGIDVDSFAQKQDFDLKNTFKIVQIGRLDRFHKRQDLSLEALHLLVKDNPKNIHLDIIGDGPSESFLKEMATKLNLDDYVSFLGNRSKDYIRKNLAHYDLLIQPSAWEGFGLTIIEAMSACVPTLISNVDGMKTISKNGELSYIFETGNAQDLANKILQIMHSPTKERRELVERAYIEVKREFDISRTVANYQKEYVRILEEINRK